MEHIPTIFILHFALGVSTVAREYLERQTRKILRPN